MKSISSDQKRPLLTLIDGAKHPFQEGEVFILQDIEGMNREGSGSINGAEFKVSEVVNSNSFRVEGDTSVYSPYVRNGIVRNVKVPRVLEFGSLSDQLTAPVFDLEDQDYLKFGRSKHLAATLYLPAQQGQRLSCTPLEIINKILNTSF